MPLTDTVEIPRRVMNLFFMVDTSGSMEGGKIAATNNAIRNVIPIIEDISAKNPDAEIKIAVMDFSDDVKWVYSEPRSPQDFVWEDLEAGGLTSLGEACVELSYKLSRKEGGYMTSASGSYQPAIILLSDGLPTDDFDGGLQELQKNNWFNHATKVAIAIGDETDRNLLMKFTGNSELVLTVHNVDTLKRVIRLVAVTSSTIGSQSSTATDKTKKEQVIEAVTKEVKDIDGVDQGTGPSTSYDDWD